MYVGVPKNYGGTALRREREIEKIFPRQAMPPTLPHAVQTQREKPHHENNNCKDCDAKDKNPLSCLLSAFRRTKNGGIDAEDLLLIGLIILLLGKDGNEDIIIILAMLLLI